MKVHPSRTSTAQSESLRAPRTPTRFAYGWRYGGSTTQGLLGELSQIFMRSDTMEYYTRASLGFIVDLYEEQYNALLQLA